MQALVGTSGFAYKEWKGSFYPEDLPQAEMLAYYARQLPSVEINNTFYRMPSEEQLVKWEEEVPEGFTFVLKASRRITHFKRLRDTGELLEYFCGNAAVLGKKLGAVLFQLPPNFKRDLERLKGFLEELPPGCPAAFEFRHPSWVDGGVHAALEAAGAALCQAETQEEGIPELVSTASWVYLRLRRDEYSEQELDGWAARLADGPWERAFVFLKHEARGPAYARRLLEGLARKREDAGD